MGQSRTDEIRERSAAEEAPESRYAAGERREGKVEAHRTAAAEAGVVSAIEAEAERARAEHLAAGMAANIEREAERIQRLDLPTIDGLIRFWRKRRAAGRPNAECYIDAFQTIRVNHGFVELPPDEAQPKVAEKVALKPWTCSLHRAKPLCPSDCRGRGRSEDAQPQAANGGNGVPKTGAEALRMVRSRNDFELAGLGHAKLEMARALLPEGTDRARVKTALHARNYGGHPGVGFGHVLPDFEGIREVEEEAVDELTSGSIPEFPSLEQRIVALTAVVERGVEYLKDEQQKTLASIGSLDGRHGRRLTALETWRLAVNDAVRALRADVVALCAGQRDADRLIEELEDDVRALGAGRQVKPDPEARLDGRDVAALEQRLHEIAQIAARPYGANSERILEVVARAQAVLGAIAQAVPSDPDPRPCDPKIGPEATPGGPALARLDEMADGLETISTQGLREVREELSRVLSAAYADACDHCEFPEGHTTKPEPSADNPCEGCGADFRACRTCDDGNLWVPSLEPTCDHCGLPRGRCGYEPTPMDPDGAERLLRALDQRGPVNLCEPEPEPPALALLGDMAREKGGTTGEALLEIQAQLRDALAKPEPTQCVNVSAETGLADCLDQIAKDHSELNARTPHDEYMRRLVLMARGHLVDLTGVDPDTPWAGCPDPPIHIGRALDIVIEKAWNGQNISDDADEYAAALQMVERLRDDEGA